MKKKNIFTGLFTMSMIASTKIVTVSVCSPGATWNKWIVDKKLMMSRYLLGINVVVENGN